MALAAALLMAFATSARSQDIEPRAYSNAPIGVNFLIAGYAYTRGGIAFDTSLPISDPNLHTSNAVLGYARVVDFWGQSGKVDVVVPYTWLSGWADYAGGRIDRVVNGFGDPAFRVSVNLYGAPALTLSEFTDWQQDLIVGVSLRASVPWGQYDSSRVVNIGSHRWAFKPEVGASKTVGPWTLEGTAAAVLFTDNDDFYGGSTRSLATSARALPADCTLTSMTVMASVVSITSEPPLGSQTFLSSALVSCSSIRYAVNKSLSSVHRSSRSARFGAT
jgi:hypothetical protein